MITRISGLLVVALVAVGLAAGTQLDESRGRVVCYKENFEAYKKLKCGKPKRNIIYVEEELKRQGTYNHEDVYLPRAVVVHLCRNETGCCANREKSCQAKSEERLQFQIATKPKHGRGRVKFIYLPLTNHTQCGCS